jgi:hypothetical protein
MVGTLLESRPNSAKHHKTMWAQSRRDYEIARANLEARAGQTERAQRLIFPSSGGGVVDSAYWEEVETTATDGTTTKEWHFITDPEKAANKALGHVQGLFPQPLGWRPKLRGATFPVGYAFEGCTVVSPRLTDILTAVDEVGPPKGSSAANDDAGLHSADPAATGELGARNVGYYLRPP